MGRFFKMAAAVTLLIGSTVVLQAQTYCRWDADPLNCWPIPNGVDIFSDADCRENYGEVVTDCNSSPDGVFCDWGPVKPDGTGGCFWQPGKTAADCEADWGTVVTSCSEGPGPGPGPDPDPFTPTGVLWDAATGTLKGLGGWNSAKNLSTTISPTGAHTAILAALSAGDPMTFILGATSGNPQCPATQPKCDDDAYGVFGIDFQSAGAPADLRNAVSIKVTYTLTSNDVGAKPAARIKLKSSDPEAFGWDNHAVSLEYGENITRVYPLSSFVQLWNKPAVPVSDVLPAAVGFEFHVSSGNGEGTASLTLKKVEWSTEAKVCPYVNFKARTNYAVRASYNRGSVSVNWNAGSRIADGTISLVNVKGVTVASSQIRANSSNISARLGSKAVLPTGMYFIRINARDVNGKQILQQVPVNIVK